MINLNEIIEITTTLYKPQINWKICRYYNTDCYTVKVDLERIYFNKYSKIDYNSVINPFNVVVC